MIFNSKPCVVIVNFISIERASRIARDLEVILFLDNVTMKSNEKKKKKKEKRENRRCFWAEHPSWKNEKGGGEELTGSSRIISIHCHLI